jgi:hypothetical protein
MRCAAKRIGGDLIEIESRPRVAEKTRLKSPSLEWLVSPDPPILAVLAWLSNDALTGKTTRAFFGSARPRKFP